MKRIAFYGGSFDPPRFLEAGQTVEIEVEGIGILRNPVIAEADALGRS